MEKSKIDRINALARKAKSIGLTERETAERNALRKEYLTDMRASFRQQLDNTYVQTADGAGRIAFGSERGRLLEACSGEE